MSKSKHTPGPWTICFEGELNGETEMIIEKEGCPIASVRGTDDMSCLEDDEYASVASECKANAQLIVNAPELLDELEKAHVIIKCMLQEIPQEAKSVLAKYLIRQGISNEGMTRAHERESVIAKAKGL
ncbi:MAG TPA: hypothetical protein VL728_19595 [Cyclobacteriaceae bacterium]|jgi:hypothetical protein|nr:hypothetical protein [Cyclobacteriaceae bacterium]